MLSGWSGLEESVTRLEGRWLVSMPAKPAELGIGGQADGQIAVTTITIAQDSAEDIVEQLDRLLRFLDSPR